jgi:hypothetical protein
VECNGGSLGQNVREISLPAQRKCTVGNNVLPILVVEEASRCCTAMIQDFAPDHKPDRRFVTAKNPDRGTRVSGSGCTRSS